MTYDDAGSGPPDGPRRHDRQEGCLDRPPDPLPTRVDSLPDLPAGYEAALSGALDSLGVAIGAAARQAIDGHVRLLLAWNAAINLTAVRDPTEIAVRHVADSLIGLRPLRERAVDSILDLGSGGGYPGLPLAAALPAGRALLVESVAKKARFLETVVAATGVAKRVGIVAERAETVARDPAHRETWPAVTARAVAALAELVELALPLLRPGGVLVAWKSGDPGDRAGLGGELAAAGRALEAVGDGEIHVGRSAGELAGRDPAGGSPIASIADHRLVVVERGRRAIASTWPRDPAVRRRAVW